MTLQEALQEIQKFKAENKELRAEYIELKSHKEGIDYPKLLDDALQKIADLTTKLEKSEAENEKLKAQNSMLEDEFEHNDVMFSEIYHENQFNKKRVLQYSK